MNRRWCVVLAGCALLKLHAQGPDTAQAVIANSAFNDSYDSYRIITPPAHRLAIEAVGLYDASSIRNELITGLYKGGYIDRDLRERSAEAMNGNNRFGYELGARITYSWGHLFGGNVNARPRISIAHTDIMGLSFTDDAYNLTFFGNQAYEGRTASLGPARMEQVRYQTIGFGIEDKRTRSFIELQVVNGQSLNAMDLDRADLHTGMDGRYLRLDLNGGYSRTDTTADAFGKSRGLGAAVSFEVRRPFTLCRHSALFTFGIRDLGFIAWNDRSLRVPKDSTVLYEGFRVDDILDLDGALSGQQTWQDTLGLNYERGAFLRPLPALMHASLFCALDEQRSLVLRIEQRALPGYVPRTTLMYRHMIEPRWLQGRASISYGGFGGLRFGLGAACQLTRTVHAQLDLPNVAGMVSGSARGKAVLLGVNVSW
jgi:hypothetical protein